MQRLLLAAGGSWRKKNAYRSRIPLISGTWYAAWEGKGGRGEDCARSERGLEYFRRQFIRAREDIIVLRRGGSYRCNIKREKWHCAAGKVLRIKKRRRRKGKEGAEKGNRDIKNLRFAVCDIARLVIIVSLKPPTALSSHHCRDCRVFRGRNRESRSWALSCISSDPNRWLKLFIALSQDLGCYYLRQFIYFAHLHK